MAVVPPAVAGAVFSWPGSRVEWWIRGFQEKGKAHPPVLVDQPSHYQSLFMFTTGTPDALASGVAC